MLQLFNIHVTNEAKKNVNDVLESTWLNEGKYVKLFEESLKEWGMTNPIMLNSCTSALHLSLTCIGVGPGDEVILPAQTFIATGIAVLMAGANPVFADINPNTGNICPNDFKNKITDKTKAVIPVHWGGLPCDMDAITKYANEKGVEVVEDAAHAFGATYKDQPIGSISKFTCFSFQAIKFITSGDGGAVCTNDEETAEELKRRKWFGIDKGKMKRNFEGDRDVEVNELGFKYNMNDFTAAMGVGNMVGAKERLEKRREIARVYDKEFVNISGIRLLNNLYSQSSYWLYTMLVDDRHDFIKAMKDKEIGVSVVDRRIDKYAVFGSDTELPGQEEFDKKQISIPVHEGLNGKDVFHIIKSIKGGW